MAAFSPFSPPVPALPLVLLPLSGSFGVDFHGPFLRTPLEGAFPPGLRQAGPPPSHTGPDRTALRLPRSCCVCLPGLGQTGPVLPASASQAPPSLSAPLAPPLPPFLGAAGEAWRTPRCRGPRVSLPAAVRIRWQPGSQALQQVGRPHVSLASAFFPCPAGTFSGERSLGTASALGVGASQQPLRVQERPVSAPRGALQPPPPRLPSLPGRQASTHLRPLPVPPPLPQLACISPASRPSLVMEFLESSLDGSPALHVTGRGAVSRSRVTLSKLGSMLATTPGPFLS